MELLFNECFIIDDLKTIDVKGKNITHKAIYAFMKKKGTSVNSRSGKRRASCNWSKNGGQVQMSPGPVRRGRFSLEFDNPYYLCDRDGNLIGEGTLGGDGNR